MLTPVPATPVAAAGGLDAILSAAGGSLPQLGGVVVFVYIVILLLRREAQSDARHTTELTRLSTTHDAELAELRTENTRLREQRDAAETALRAYWRPGVEPPP